MKTSILFLIFIIPFCRTLEGIINIELMSNKCFHRSVSQIIRCQLTFEQSVQKIVGKRAHDVNATLINEQQLKTVCCGLWDMTSCIKSSAIKWSNCKPEVLRKFVKDIEQIKHRSDYSHCNKHYKEGSLKCGFPVWITVILVVIGVLIIAVMTCFVHRYCNRMQTPPDSINLIQH